MIELIKALFQSPIQTLSKSLQAQILVFGTLLEILGVVLLIMLPPLDHNAVLVGMLIIFLVAAAIYTFLESRLATPAQATHPTTEQVSMGHSHSSASQSNPVPLIPKPNVDSSELRRSYLTLLISQTSRINLEGVNLRDASQEKDTRLSLQAIYTALLTLTPEEHERIEQGQLPEPSLRRSSALNQLNQHKHLMLLGDPGSGKSTFVNFVTLCLAGAGLEHPDINLNLLTFPLPDDKGYDEEIPQPWIHGPRLPVRIILRDFAARGLPANNQPITLDHFWDYLTEELKKSDLEEFVPHLRRYLKEQGGLLLFDGLDEVPEANQRRDQIIQLVKAVSGLLKCRVLVTSRVYAFRRQDWEIDDFAVAVLRSFSDGQIIRFIDHWYDHLTQLGAITSADEAQARAEDLKNSILHNGRIHTLAERPLLLTLMAGLHAWRGGKLPDRRELLYHETVDLLLDRWQQRTVVRLPDGREEKQPSLEEFLKVGKDNVRRALNELAFQAHRRQPREQLGTADIAGKDLVDALLSVSPVQDDTRPTLLTRYLRERAGLLIERGEGVYTFPHRTFQEYLAACHLTETDFPDTLAELACQDPERWREVTLLAAAKVARGSDSYWYLAEALCPKEPPAVSESKGNPSPTWGAYMAGQLLAESANLSRISQRNQYKLERIQHWLVYILQSGALTAIERAGVGDVLAHLGDPRFSANQFFLPFSQSQDVLGFILIPAGTFKMGSDKKDQVDSNTERPQHDLPLPDYYLARYPVTVAQFMKYVEECGGKSYFGNPGDHVNHPLVNLTWHETLGYCRWLTEKLCRTGKERLQQDRLSELEFTFWDRLANQNWQVTLPSEAEWEKAARGDKNRYIYPWPGVYDTDRANTAETQIGNTSAVGCFPEGTSPYGLLDMSGNIWEWTRSQFRHYPYDASDGREDLRAGDDVPRVLRGGSFSNESRFARCSSRYGSYPNLRNFSYGFRVGVCGPVHI